MRHARTVFFGMLLILLIFAISCARDTPPPTEEGDDVVKTLTIQEQLGVFKLQVGLVYVDIFYEGIGPIVSAPLSNGFFVNETTVLMTAHQNNLDEPFADAEVGYHFIRLPVRERLYALEPFAYLTSSKDFVFFNAVLIDDSAAVKHPNLRLPPFLTPNICRERLKKDDRVSIITLKGSSPHVKTGRILGENAAREIGVEKTRYYAVEGDKALFGEGDSGSPVLSEENEEICLAGIISIGPEEPEPGLVLVERIEPHNLP